MMKTETKWTVEQNDAIHAHGGTVLVSAAAGSGKTAVLVERVIQMITNAQNPVPADRLLIATFSNAAAAEMRQRIDKKLDSLISEHPEISYYRKQKILLGSASISTVHSFCLGLVREHFHKLNILPDFRIGDESELQLIKNQTAEEVIESYYDTENPIFYDLVELISSGRDDKKLIETMLTLYEFVQSHPFPHEWLDEKFGMYNSEIPPQSSPWGKIMLKYAHEALEYAMTSCNDALGIIREFEDMTKAYEKAFMELWSILQNLMEIVEVGDWNRLVKTLQNIKNPKLKPLSGDSPEKSQVKSIKEYIQKKVIGELRDKVFIASEEEYKQDIELLKEQIKLLFEMVSDFMRQFGENKKERNLVDFSDLEHMTLSLLVQKNEDGSYSKTDFASQVAEKYHSVLVDEYQDTNEVQDLIFKCVSVGEENLFMVGDVKQSIYAFRQAMPEIFINRRKKSSSYDGEHFPATIVLDKNFRSRDGICEGINSIFEKIMSDDVGGVNYRLNEQLVPGAEYPSCDSPSTNVVIVNVSADNVNPRILEAQQIGEKISSMVDGGFMVFDKDTKIMRPCTYSDFCILMRAKTHTELYERELRAFGIPVWSDFSKNFFGSKEILFLLSFLSVIDNPLSDVDICSAMMSPIFGFTPDHMAMLSIKKKTSVYVAVLDAVKNGDEKCAHFLNILTQLRTFATVSSVSEIIEKISELTSFDLKVSVMNGGETRLSNLNMIIKQAEEYENSGYRGLSGFVRFMKHLMDDKLDIPRSMTMPGSENVVKIMTIHRSKGLEFPICFLADCSKKFNLGQLSENTLLHSELGFSCKYRNPDTLLQYSTIPHEALKLEMKRDSLSEEIRVLYVALTRAREHLFMMCSIKNPERKIGSIVGNTGKASLNPFVVRSANSYSDWILMSVMDLEESNQLRSELGLPTIIAEPSGFIGIEYIVPEEKQGEENITELSFTEKPDQDFLTELEQRCAYVYPNIEQTFVPTKLAVSDIAAELSSEHDNIILRRPKFKYRAGLSPAEVGNAHHTFMQFANYNKARQNPEEEVARMVAMGYLRSEEGKAIKIPLLDNFFHGSLGQRMFASDKIFRELKFIIGRDDSIHENQTMIQGVADCVFFEGDEFIIVDYKTDYVSDGQVLKDRYSAQLEIYKNALEQSFGARAKELLIYSFSLSREIVL